MRRTKGFRGRPLVALLLTLGGWVTMRIMPWESGPADAAEPTNLEATASSVSRPSMRAATLRSVPLPVSAPVRSPIEGEASDEGWSSSSFMPRRTSVGVAMLPLAAIPARGSAAPPTPPTPSTPAVPEPSLAQDAAPGPPPGAIWVPIYQPPRWTGDGWVLVRGGGKTASAGGFAAPTYGASQAGAVLRYRLAPMSEHAPAVYLRASAALNGSREREVAAGLSLRPIGDFPLVAAVEGRVNDQPGGTSVRPSAFAYTELPPVRLPMKLRAEIYAQAGYVGGNFATGYVDGQVRVDRRVGQAGRGELRLGGSVWGGAQKGASRVDIGPSATYTLPIGATAGARLSADWRFRISGNAEPESGPALTLSAGF